MTGSRPGPRYVQVMLCVNDDHNGMPHGHVVALGIPDEDLEMECQYWGYRDAPRFSHLAQKFQIRVGRRTYLITDYRTWVGNWCWDAVQMDTGTAADLVAYLRERGWQIVAGREKPAAWLKEALA